MKVIKPRSVELALKPLDDDERRQVLSWFDRLGNWEIDENIRKMAKAMKYRDTYDLDTPDDLRIFFTLDEANQEIHILDLAKPSRFRNAMATTE